MGFKVYVGGPINDVSFDEARARNQMIVDALASFGLEGVDPLDFEGAEKLAGLHGNLDRHAAELGITKPARIVSGCLALIDECDAMLINVVGMKASGAQTWGTPCEQMYAHLAKKPIVVVHDDFSSAWLTVLASHTCETLSAAIDALCTMRNMKVLAADVAAAQADPLVRLGMP